MRAPRGGTFHSLLLMRRSVDGRFAFDTLMPPSCSVENPFSNYANREASSCLSPHSCPAADCGSSHIGLMRSLCSQRLHSHRSPGRVLAGQPRCASQSVALGPASPPSPGLPLAASFSPTTAGRVGNEGDSSSSISAPKCSRRVVVWPELRFQAGLARPSGPSFSLHRLLDATDYWKVCPCQRIHCLSSRPIHWSG